MKNIKKSKSQTPICDFVKNYTENEPLRLHMPGHKGKSFLGFENADITEISGADSLYQANSIIAESEENARNLFGSRYTLYSTEGSSLSIKAMLYIAKLKSKGKNEIFAFRNAHRAFLCGCALLNINVHWLYNSENENSYLSSDVSAQELEKELTKAEEKPFAVYITSPDYLGNRVDIQSISEICKKFSVPLLVDNAHGAYLKFLSHSEHPLDLGADMCCDSAHKTLNVLTGGAYLHISKDFAKKYGITKSQAKNALSLFGSTSPSYLILQSLDKANEYIQGDYRENLQRTINFADKLKSYLKAKNYRIEGCEPLKLTIATKSKGYTGIEFAEILEQNNIFCEFYDRDFVTMMFTSETSEKDFEKLFDVISEIKGKTPILELPPKQIKSEVVLTPNQAILSESEPMEIEKCEGKILASISLSCPPAVPIVALGERITKEAISAFLYYGIKECFVVKE